jgi:magnesium chelatase family protein
MNPCSCGLVCCACGPREARSYRRRLSGPLLDRIDLHVDVPALSYEERQGPPGERCSVVAARVEAARRRQLARWPTAGARTNAAMDTSALRGVVRLDSAAEALLQAAVERLQLSLRATESSAPRGANDRRSQVD